MSFNNAAYRILTAEEKASLTLQTIENKSTWEAGQILNKSHYKYLEIQKRAEKFFEVFTRHYNLYGKLIPDGLGLNCYFEQYITIAITQRVKIKDIICQIDNDNYKTTK